MSDKLKDTTKIAVVNSIIEDYELGELLTHYAPELTEQQRRELTISLGYMLIKTVTYTELLSQGTPVDTMTIYNAGVAEGYECGHATGYADGYKQAILDSTNGGLNT
jgi:hypothetical protein